MIGVLSSDLRERSARQGFLAMLQDKGPAPDGMVLIDGSAADWAMLSSATDTADQGFLDALAVTPAVVIARVRGHCAGLAASVARTVDLAAAVDSVVCDEVSWAFRGTEAACEAWLADVAEAISVVPEAAVTVTVQLRHSSDADTNAGLVSESTAYAMLQAGPEFRRWLNHCP